MPPGPDYLPAQGQLILALQKSGRSEEALQQLDSAGSQLPPQAQPNIAPLKGQPAGGSGPSKPGHNATQPSTQCQPQLRRPAVWPRPYQQPHG